MNLDTLKWETPHFLVHGQWLMAAPRQDIRIFKNIGNQLFPIGCYKMQRLKAGVWQPTKITCGSEFVDKLEAQLLLYGWLEEPKSNPELTRLFSVSDDHESR